MRSLRIIQQAGPARVFMRTLFKSSAMVPLGLLAMGVIVLSPTLSTAQSPGGASLNGLNPALVGPRGSVGQNGATGQNNRPNLPDGFGLNQNTQDERAQNTPQAQNQPIDPTTTATVAPPATGAVTNPPVTSEPEVQQVIGNIGTVQGPGGQTADPNPFQPLGVRKGRFILRPSLEVGFGFTTNSTQDVNGVNSAFVTTQSGLALESDFSRHAVGLNIQFGLDRFSDGEDTSDIDVNANGNVRYDISQETSVTGNLGVVAQEDDLQGVGNDPLETTVTASLQLDHQLRQIDTATQIRLSRNINGSFIDAAGITQNQDDQNSTLLGFNLRGTLNRSASLQPFAEVDLSREVFDESLDAFGNNRNVTGLRGVIGIEIDRGDKLNGEIGIGFGQNLIEGPGIPNFGGFVIEANLNWSPQRLTTINFNANTTFDAFPSVATPGDTTYDFTVQATRQIRENFSASLGGGVQFQIDGLNNDVDTTFDANIGLAWSLNRVFSVTAGYAFSREISNDGFGDFTSNAFTVGLRAER